MGYPIHPNGPSQRMMCACASRALSLSLLLVMCVGACLNASETKIDPDTHTTQDIPAARPDTHQIVPRAHLQHCIDQSHVSRISMHLLRLRPAKQVLVSLSLLLHRRAAARARTTSRQRAHNSTPPSLTPPPIPPPPHTNTHIATGDGHTSHGAASRGGNHPLRGAAAPPRPNRRRGVRGHIRRRLHPGARAAALLLVVSLGALAAAPTGAAAAAAAL